jgi:hypothetical protein
MESLKAIEQFMRHDAKNNLSFHAMTTEKSYNESR